MKTNIKISKPLLIPFSIKDEKIFSNYSIKEIRKRVLEGEIIILKNVFPENQMNDLKNMVISWGNETKLFPHGESPGKYPLLNYHRIDDGSVPSVCPHIFHQYGFNSIDELETNYRFALLEVANVLLEIQNLVAETNFRISEKDLRLKILQYPEGGGFLDQHTHPLEPQKIGLILSLSKYKLDFEIGSAAFMSPNGYVATSEFHDIGDIIIFRYDIPHEVTPVNPGKKNIDWNIPTGKWSIVLELRETHGLSHK